MSDGARDTPAQRGSEAAGNRDTPAQRGVSAAHDGLDDLAGARARLAAAQAELAAALLAGGPAPAGFDERRVRIEARALRNKRRRVTELVRPDLASGLGERYAPLFAAWAPAHPRLVGVSARADADAFGAWLVEHGHLPPPPRRRWRRWRRWWLRWRRR